MAAQYGQGNPIVDTFKLVAETRRQIEVINDRARAAVKQFYRSPGELSDFIERHGTPVYVIRGGLLGLFVLSVLGFEPGFIPNPPPENVNGRRRYETLCRLLEWQEGKPACHSGNGVFVLTKSLFTVGFLSHQLHHWLSARAGLHGYQTRAQELYKVFWSRDQGRISGKMLELEARDLTALKEAINRDMEALRFVREVTDEIFRPARQGKNLSRGTARA